MQERLKMICNNDEFSVASWPELSEASWSEFSEDLWETADTIKEIDAIDKDWIES